MRQPYLASFSYPRITGHYSASKLSADTPFLEQTMNSENENTVEPLASNSNSEGKWKLVWVSEGSSEMGRLQNSMCHVKNW